MPPRAFATQVVQLGKETVPGTPVAATTRLQAMRIMPKPTFESERFAPSGYTAPTVSIPLQEWTEADVEGRATYTDADPVFAGAIGQPVITTPTGGTLARQRVFTFDGVTPANPAVYTVEYGDPTLARRFAHGMFNGLSMKIARDSLEFNSAMIARNVQTAFALTSTGITSITPVPIAAGQWDVYVDDLAANLGTTKFLEAYEAEFELAERYEPTWTINSALPSFTSYVEKSAEDQEHTGTLTVGASTSMEAYLTTIRTGAKKFVRLEAVGPIIETTLAHRLTIDMCVFITGTPGYDDLNGLLVLPFEFQVGRDEVWGKAMTVTTVNGIAA